MLMMRDAGAHTIDLTEIRPAGPGAPRLARRSVEIAPKSLGQPHPSIEEASAIGVHQSSRAAGSCAAAAPRKRGPLTLLAADKAARVARAPRSHSMTSLAAEAWR